MVNGVQQNKEHWLELAQNVHNRSSSCNTGTITEITTTPSAAATPTIENSMATSTTTTASKTTDGDTITLVSHRKNDSDNNNLNNNNVIVNNNRCVSQSHDDNNIIICNGTNNSEIPKIVGKTVGRLSSQNIFAPKLQNGINCEKNSTRDPTHNDAMDQ